MLKQYKNHMGASFLFFCMSHYRNTKRCNRPAAGGQPLPTEARQRPPAAGRRLAGGQQWPAEVRPYI